MPAPIIRLAREDDAPAIDAIYGPYCTDTAVSFETAAPGPEAIATRIRSVVAQLPWLVLEVDGVVAGYVYASRHHNRAAYRWAVDTAVYVAPAFHGQRVGTALYTTLFALLQAQGYARACAGITMPNPASQRLHESFGFVPVGTYRRIGHKFGAWRDVAWFQADLRPDDDPPLEPRPIGDLPSAVWADAIAAGVAALRLRSRDGS